MRTEPSLAPRLLVGGDISALTVIEEHGGVFRDKGKPGDAIRIMANHGASCFRLRLFVNPTGRNVVVNDLAYTIALAKRIKAAGATLLLDFHYSDTWADPGHQDMPEAWKELSFDELLEQVYRHTRNSLAAMKAAGVLPEYVQVGNEITPGMLWPHGKLYGAGDPETQFAKLAGLLKEGVRGVRDASGPDREVRIVIHIDKGGNWLATKRFFERIRKHDVPFDVIGLSFYPFWHGTVADARRTVHNAARVFDRDVWIVETAYPWRPFSWKNDKYKYENLTHATTPQGQKAFLVELIQTMHETPGNHGLGVLWWYPESVRVEGLNVWHGGTTALFDDAGNALPALDAFSLPD